jgi:hypothetical protein
VRCTVVLSVYSYRFSVSLSVRLSHAGAFSSSDEIEPCGVHHKVQQSFLYSGATRGRSAMRASLERGSQTGLPTPENEFLDAFSRVFAYITGLRLEIDTYMLHIITSTDDKLSIGTTFDDLG